MQVELFTDAINRPRSTEDPRPYDAVESETKKSRPGRDETAKDLVVRITAMDSVLRVPPSIDLTDDAMVASGKFPVAELENGRTRELDTLIDFSAFGEISELSRGHKAYDMVWMSGVETKFDQDCVFVVKILLEHREHSS